MKPFTHTERTSAAHLTRPGSGHHRRPLTVILDAHRPYPALLLDRRWRVVAANDALTPLLAGCAEHLLDPPIDVLRLTLAADGLAPRIENLPTWRAHLLGRVRRRFRATGDPELGCLLAEFGPTDAEPIPPTEPVVMLRLRVDDAVLSLFSMSAAVHTAGDVTVEELAIELFFPTDDMTRTWFADRDGAVDIREYNGAPGLPVEERLV